MNNQLVLKSDEFESKLLNINSFLYSLFHILMIKTNYDHLEKLKRARSTR